MSVPGSFKIKGADGTTIEVLPGEYYFNTKARARRMMRNSLSRKTQQVDACLELATMAFQQELAVTMEAGEKRPLAPSDICRLTGLPKQDVRLSLVELEVNGLAERRSDDSGRLRNGHILIYVWVVPRPRKTQKGSRAGLPLPPWLPQSWEPLKPLIKRLKLSLAIDEADLPDYLLEGEQVALDYQRSDNEVTRFFGKVCAPTKKGAPRKEDGSKRKSSPSPVSVEETSRAKAKTTNTSSQSKGPRKPPATSEDDLIEIALRSYGPVPSSIKNTLVRACRANAPECTDEEIAHFIHLKAPLANSNPAKFLEKAVPECFEGNYKATLPAKLLRDPKVKKEADDLSFLRSLASGDSE